MDPPSAGRPRGSPESLTADIRRAPLADRLSAGLREKPAVLAVGALAIVAVACLLAWRIRFREPLTDQSVSPSAGSVSTSREPAEADRSLIDPTIALTEGSVPAPAVARAPAIAELPTDEPEKNPLALVLQKPEDASQPSNSPAMAEIPAAEAVIAVAPKQAEVDVELRLSQPIKKFEQLRAVPVRELLELLEELIGVPIRADREALGAAASDLDRSITLRLPSTTVGGILTAVLQQVDLEWEIDGQAIRVRPKAAP